MKMQKFGKLFRKAALTAAICLGLSQSVWAMPTGGTPVGESQVTVNGKHFSGGVFRDGATVMTWGPSIINWKSFGIEAGKSLTFDTTNGALLNRVIGGNVSEIYGTLNQEGANPLFLVNPNGILVGNGATINASNMILSTLEISNDAFWDGVSDGYGKTFEFITPKGKSIAAPLTIKGATVNVEGATIEGRHDIGALKAVGGTVEVADGVTFTAIKSLITLAAGQAIILPYDNASTVRSITANAENAVTFADSKFIQDQDHGAKLMLTGGNIRLEDSTINIMDGGTTDDVFLYARSSDNAMTTDNVVTVKNTDISIDGDMFIEGGKIDIQNSTLRSGYDANYPPRLEIIAAESRGRYGVVEYAEEQGSKIIAAEYGRTYTMTPQNTVAANGLTIGEAQTVHIAGGNVTLTNSVINAKNTYVKDDVMIAAASGLTNGYGGVAFENGVQPIYTDSGDKSSDYAVTLKNSKVTLETTGDNDPSLNIIGGKVTLDKSDVSLTGGNDNGINIYAASGADSDADAVHTLTAGPDNMITITNNSKIDSKGERLELAGGTISITNESTVETTGTPFIVASDTIGFEEQTGLSTDVPVAKGTKGEIAVSTDSKILQNGVDVTDKFATSRPAPVPKPEPEPQPAPEPKFDEDVRKNIDNGAKEMGKVLTDNNTPEKRQKATRDLVDSINQAAATDTQKAAQITGVMKAIREGENLSDAEKIALQNEVVSEFEQTQQANNELNNTVVNATQTTNSAAMNQSAAADAIAPGAASEESPVSGV